MDKFSPDQLIYVLVFAAIVLLQYLMKRFGPQQQPQSSKADPPAQIPETVKETPSACAESSMAVGYFGRAEAPGAFSALPGRRFARTSLLGTKREVQNAIVVATILGPCRAFEPHDVR